MFVLFGSVCSHPEIVGAHGGIEHPPVTVDLVIVGVLEFARVTDCAVEEKLLEMD